MLCSESVLRLRDYLVLLQHCGSFVKKSIISVGSFWLLLSDVLVTPEPPLNHAVSHGCNSAQDNPILFLQ